MRVFLTAVVTPVCVVSSLLGQPSRPSANAAPSLAPRWSVGVAADIGQPVGDLKRNINNAVGLQAHLLLRLDRDGQAAIRVQGGWLNYGHESQPTCVGSTPGCRVAVDITTANGILTLGVGPQVTLQRGPLRTYGYGLVGVSRFATLSSVGGGIVPDIVAADENFGDAGLFWTGGVGMMLPIRRSTFVDARLAFSGHGQRNYLVEGGVTDNPDGSLAFDTKRSNADLVTISIGVTTTFPWGRRKSKS